MATAGNGTVSGLKPKKVPTKEQRDAAHPERSVWVAASAGSGKTQVLVDRVIRLLLDGAEPQAILCLTFTKAAAAEMSNRLFQRLGDWIGLSDAALDEELQNLGVKDASAKTRSAARRLFARALETPGGLKIQTIHAFCERLLQQFPVESGMAPGFRVLEDQERDQLFRDALLQSLMSADKDTQTAWAFLDDGSVSTLETLEKLVIPFVSGSNGMRQRLSDMAQLANVETMLRDILGLGADEHIADVEDALVDIGEKKYLAVAKLLQPDPPKPNHPVSGLLAQVVAARDAAGRIQALAELFTRIDGNGRIPRAKLVLAPTQRAHPQETEWLKAEQENKVELMQRHGLLQTLNANLAIYRAMAGLLARVNAAKRARGLYDFDDLIARTAQLLEGHEAAQWVLYKLDKGLSHILVDEAQDTSPAQWSIIKALAGEFFTTSTDDAGRKRTVFAVGDIKQSIFSFQGADIAAFETARKSFSSALDKLQDRLHEVDLSVSYRSNAQVLKVVDEVFAPGREARSGFGVRADMERPHTAFTKDRIGLVELWDIVRPDDKEEVEDWRAPTDALARSHPRLKLANRIALAVKDWIGKRVIAGRDRTVSAGDILILLQSRNVLFHALIGALRRHGVPVAGADRLKLQHSLIVQDLMMLGQFIRMPDDDHGLACVLKSPLVPEPMTEEELFTLAHGRETQSLWERIPAHSPNAVMLAQALTSSQTPYQLFSTVLQRAKKLTLQRLGQEADDAAQEFLTLALDYEQRHGTSLTGFLDWFSSGETQIKREMEADTGLVRLMTVHGSKGLEAPIVILADAADAGRGRIGRLVEVMDDGPWRGAQLFLPNTLMVGEVIDKLKEAARQQAQAERMRLLYVGMTRAADELYICGSVNKTDADKVPKTSWYPHVAAAVQDAAGLAGVRVVTDDPELTLWRFGAEPVWRDAAVTEKTEAVTIPLWATQTVVAELGKPLPLLPARDSDSFDRRAAEQGIATHRLIELMAEGNMTERGALGRAFAKRLGLPETVVQATEHLLDMPELKHLFGPQGQSEVAIDGTVPGLGRVTGRVDRLAIAADVIYLLDYKTNRSPPLTIPAEHPYARQMAGYVALLQQAYPGHVIKAALFWTQSGALYWLSSTLLSQALDLRIKETA
jgi:ATP-dependent helicase/nuclease subunit A